MQAVIIHIWQYILLRRQHTVQILRRNPFVRAKIYRQCNDGQQLIRLIKARQKFRSCLRLLVAPPVGFRNFLHLRHILNRVIEHIPHRHRVMNFRLVFNAKQQVRCLVILHCRHGFQHIAVSLQRDGLAFLAVRKHDGGGVKRSQLLRLDHLSALIEIKIECIRKYFPILHIVLGDRILVRHLPHLPFLSLIIPPYRPHVKTAGMILPKTSRPARRFHLRSRRAGFMNGIGIVFFLSRMTRQKSAYSEVMTFLSCGVKEVMAQRTVTRLPPPMVQVKSVRS